MSKSVQLLIWSLLLVWSGCLLSDFYCYELKNIFQRTVDGKNYPLHLLGVQHLEQLMACVLLDPGLLSLEAETALAGRMISLFWIQVSEIKFSLIIS